MAMGNLMGLIKFIQKFYCLKMFLFNFLNKKCKVQHYHGVTL